MERSNRFFGASLAILGAAFAIPEAPRRPKPEQEAPNVAPEPGHTKPRFGKRAKLRQAHAERVAEMAADPWRRAVESMGNRTRKAWAAAGYPGLSNKNLAKLEGWLRRRVGRAA